jgi:arylamine N-acetyltransferase
MSKTLQERTNIKTEVNPALNLDAYFDRIGYKGSVDPALETLKEIILKHTATYPI